jgi:hypothetical protein
LSRSRTAIRYSSRHAPLREGDLGKVEYVAVLVLLWCRVRSMVSVSTGPVARYRPRAMTGLVLLLSLACIDEGHVVVADPTGDRSRDQQAPSRTEPCSVQ